MFCRTVLANGELPGPLISTTKGGSLNINVKNRLTNPDMDRATSIHWHGLFHNKTAWADGQAFVTQCPVVPAADFRYEFPVPGQTGTYWYAIRYLKEN